MIAVLGWTDGFGNDTYVDSIYPTIEKAMEHAEEGMKYVEFDFGSVNFDYYEANEFHFPQTKYQKKKKKKK